MDYNIQIKEDQKFILVTTVGDWEKEKDDALVRDILGAIARSGIRKVLLDLRELRFDFQLFTLFQRAHDLRDQRLEAHIFSLKVALVYLPENEKLKADFSFFETTAQNRGLPYRTFEQMQPAIEWLTG